MQHGTDTYTLPATNDAPEVVQVVARTCKYAEVRLVRCGVTSRIGLVRRVEDSWSWEHSDGERSCPIATTAAAAARALADYHDKHKPKPEPILMRRLLAPEFIA